MRGFVVVLCVLMVASGALAQVTVKGDAAAWREVGTSYQNLAKLKTYRMKMTSAGQDGAMVIEKVNPDRTRMIMQGQGFSMETIIVGNEKPRTRMTGTGMPSGWQCQSADTAPPMPAPGRAPDPTAEKGEVTISRLPDTTIDGAKTRGYQYTTKSGNHSAQNRLFVLTDRDLPRRSELLDESGKVQSTTDYYDYNAPITIDLPKCG